MSYILEALKKAEYEREIAQFIEYDDDYRKKRLLLSLPMPQNYLWWWVSVILAINILLFAVLLWPKEPLAPPQVYIVPPIVSQASTSTTNTFSYQSFNNTQELYTQESKSLPTTNLSVSGEQKLLLLSEMLTN